MYFPSASQDLLIKAAFHNNAEQYFCEWLSKYSIEDLDYYTRGIIPSLLSSVSVSHYSTDLSKKFYNYKRQLWLANSCKYQKFKILINEFKKGKVNVCLLKGTAMMLYYYKDLSQRPTTSDIDLLVSINDLEKSIAILKKFDFIPQGSFNWHSKKFEEAVLNNPDVLTDKHAISYKDKDHFNIDLHWNLSAFVNPIRFEEIFSYMSHKSSNLYVLNPEMQLFHTIVHQAFDTHKSLSMTGLIDICYLFNKTDIDIDLLAAISKNYNGSGLLEKVVGTYKVYLDKEKQSQLISIIRNDIVISDKLFAKFILSKHQVIKKFGIFFYILKEKKYNFLKTFRMMKRLFGFNNNTMTALYIFKTYFLRIGK